MTVSSVHTVQPKKFECCVLTIWSLVVVEFDEGHLKADTVRAAEEIINTLTILDDKHPPISCEKNPILHIFQSVWLKIQEVMPNS